MTAGEQLPNLPGNVLFPVDRRLPTCIRITLGDATEAKRRYPEQRLGWDDDRVVKEGIGPVAVGMGDHGNPKLIGQGAFESGIEDLGSSLSHSEGFGR